MDEKAKIRVTETAEALVSRVEDETSASEIVVTKEGISAKVFGISCLLNCDDMLSGKRTDIGVGGTITTGSIDLSRLVLDEQEGV